VSNLTFVDQSPELWIVQRRELAELIGFESRNKYAVCNERGEQVAFAAEQGKGFFGALARQFMGHWRTFEIHVFDNAKNLLFRAVHPFRWFFQRLEVCLPEGTPIGAIQQRFAFFAKRFDVEDAQGRVLLSVSSPIWKPWSFAFKRPENPKGEDVALVQKKWAGAIKEMFTDADKFRVAYPSASLSQAERILVLAAALFIDLQYFEKKAN
jgi:uncharacterized protein YxjI